MNKDDKIMSEAKRTLMAVCILAGGVLSARAATEAFTAYNLRIDYTNSAAGYWSVNGGPRTTGTVFTQMLPSQTTVQTDGSGKISGAGWMLVTYNANGVPFSWFAVDYSGKISSVAGAAPTTTFTIKGPGYTVDGTGGPTAANNSISLKFTGQPGVNPLNPNQIRLVGQITGTIQGKTPLGETSAKLPSLDAVISSSSSSFASLSPDVTQSTKKMSLFEAGFSGSGSVQGTAYKFSLSGKGASAGQSFTVSGSLGPYSERVGTNNITFYAPVSAQLKGKVKGQPVSGLTAPSQIRADLVTSH
jgi:hypothetical protein